MKSDRVKPPELILETGGVLRLSGSALLELMQAVLARDVPVRFQACGWSMVPFIQNGDVITVAPVHKHPPKLGEVVAFIQPESKKLVVHRVVAINGDAFFIQGDSDHNFPDGFVPGANLVGRVTHLWRDGKRVRLGLGPERNLIAYLSRKGWLRPLKFWLRPLQKIFSKNRK